MSDGGPVLTRRGNDLFVVMPVEQPVEACEVCETIEGQPVPVRGRPDVSVSLAQHTCGAATRFFVEWTDGRGRVFLNLLTGDERTDGGWGYDQMMWALHSDLIITLRRSTVLMGAGSLVPDFVDAVRALAVGALPEDAYAQGDLVRWAVAGATPAQHEAALAARVSAVRAWGLREELSEAAEAGEVSLDDTLAWLTAQPGPDNVLTKHARAWVRCGVLRPEDRPLPLTAVDAMLLRAANVPLDPVWGAANGRICPLVLDFALATGKEPVEIAGLLGALPRNEDPTAERHQHEWRDSRLWCRWTKEQASDLAALLAGRWEPLNWVDLADCLRAGMSADEAEEHVRSGREMEPVRVVAALSATSALP